MECPADFGQCFAIIVVLVQARVERLNGCQDFFGFLDEDLENFVINQVGIGLLGPRGGVRRSDIEIQIQ